MISASSSSVRRLEEQALESHLRNFGEDHPETGRLLRDYGACLMALERYEEAEAILLEAHNILDKCRVEGPPDIY